jgi:Ethanolamine utilization protein EutJ (predicted chaperonin)
MKLHDNELPVKSSQVEVAGFHALSMVDRPRALAAFLGYHKLTAVKVGAAIGKHPTRVSQVVWSDEAPGEIISLLRTRVGVPDCLLPRPSAGRARAA